MTIYRHGTEHPQFPQPQSQTPTQCQLTPQLFDFEYGDCNRKMPELMRARRACSRCPLAPDCLLWALVNKTLTPVGIFAGTTPRQRTKLRDRLAARLGPDWINVLAHQNRAARPSTAMWRQAS
ncbi:WhiB family transcriptional regulator [Streptomyces sp. NPDC021562]|uniref:WhiB family transcriptional regulator n=1 Tax=Streptomyces sp. NPDC021562 TaxID=3155121 RepID=UPI0033D9CEB7